MTPGFAWALTIILAVDARAHPVPTWHATQEECQRMATVRAAHLEMTGQQVAWMGCQRIRVAQTARGEGAR